MSTKPPLWILGVLCLLALATLRGWRRPAVDAEVLARARGFGVEHDPRRMSVRELRQLPGVGHKLARIVAGARDRHARNRHDAAEPLRWEDVPGIGPKRAADIRAWCSARGVAPDPLVAGDRSAAEASYARVMPALVRILVVGLAALIPSHVLLGCREAAREPVQAQETVQAQELQAQVSAAVRTLALLDGALHALEAGPKDGPVVLLLHGMRYSARNWEELGTLRLLGERGYRALALDWPGYGATPAWDGAPDAATLLGRVIDDVGANGELGARRIALLGASMGGGFAFELLAHAPERVAAFVAIAPAGSGTFAPASWSTPTLLVWGEKDAVLPPSTGEALAQRLGARLEILPGAGHAAYLEQPERFHALLLEFLASAWPAAAAR